MITFDDSRDLRLLLDLVATCFSPSLGLACLAHMEVRAVLDYAAIVVLGWKFVYDLKTNFEQAEVASAWAPSNLKVVRDATGLTLLWR